VIQQDKKDLAAWAFSDEERAEAMDGATRLQVSALVIFCVEGSGNADCDKGFERGV
jgi:hypothetical protein